MTTKTLYQIGLTMINGVGDISARHLLEFFGDAETVFKEKPAALAKVPGIGQTLIHEIRHPDVLRRAEKELAFIEKNGINCYFLTDAEYPKRLRECADAPIVCYFKGKSDLNAAQVISIVGTRHATDYGRTLIDNLLKELASTLPELLVVSGLAYGIDIHAHRTALKEKLPTVAVLAHGLDRVYPGAHRETAVNMLEAGGLLTDYPSLTNPDKANFIKRNRIIAGLSDATIVVQSAEKGGSLITADIAFSYGREVFTYPGRVNDPYSAGCNALIRNNKAGLISCAKDLIEAMNWDIPKLKKQQPLQAQILFPENSLHQQIVTRLREAGDVQINQLAIALNIPVFQLSSLLFEMEMDGIVKPMPGGVYRLA